jgi:hypothetical protein
VPRLGSGVVAEVEDPGFFLTITHPEQPCVALAPVQTLTSVRLRQAPAAFRTVGEELLCRAVIIPARAVIVAVENAKGRFVDRTVVLKGLPVLTAANVARMHAPVTEPVAPLGKPAIRGNVNRWTTAL